MGLGAGAGADWFILGSVHQFNQALVQLNITMWTIFEKESQDNCLRVWLVTDWTS